MEKKICDKSGSIAMNPKIRAHMFQAFLLLLYNITSSSILGAYTHLALRYRLPPPTLLTTPTHPWYTKYNMFLALIQCSYTTLRTLLLTTYSSVLWFIIYCGKLWTTSRCKRYSATLEQWLNLTCICLL